MSWSLAFGYGRNTSRRNCIAAPQPEESLMSLPEAMSYVEVREPGGPEHLAIAQGPQ